MSDELKINLQSLAERNTDSVGLQPRAETGDTLGGYSKLENATEADLSAISCSTTGRPFERFGGSSPSSHACPIGELAPTDLSIQKQPSMRPSPISGVTPPVETRWKKGCPSPNPGGRPKITREETAKWLEEEDEDGKTNARKAIESVGEVAQSAGRHSAAALKTLHDILPDDKKDESKGGFNIGTLNMAIVQQMTRAATGGELE